MLVYSLPFTPKLSYDECIGSIAKVVVLYSIYKILLQDEVAGRLIEEFCGLRAKLYSIKVRDEDKDGSRKSIQKAATAGTKSHLAKKYLTHQKFLDVLNETKLTVQVKQRSIRSYNHRLFNIEQRRTALSSIDDKRHVLPDGTTRALGHFRNTELTSQEKLYKLFFDIEKQDEED